MASKLLNWFHEWHATIMVLLSLLLQALLLLISTFRKRTANVYFRYLVYGIYFLSSKVAYTAFTFIVGAWLVDKSKKSFDLWAAVMLLHIAGQERLTSYSMDDNNNWRSSTFKLFTKYMLQLIAMYIQGALPCPTMLIFFLAGIRLVVRFTRLRLGTQEMMLFGEFLSDDSEMPHDHHQLMMVDNLNTDAADPLTVRRAHFLLKSSLHHLAESKCRHDVMEQIRNFFLEITPNYAIRVTEIELNFIYESFHTDGTIRKHLNHDWSIIYAVFRSFEFIFCVIVLIVFISTSPSTHLQSETTSTADWIVTNLLLWGSVFLELISNIMTVFSDWTIAALRSKHYCRDISEILFQAVPQRRRWWSDYPIFNTAPRLVRCARVLFRRWSETISKFNLVTYSIKTGSMGPNLRGYMQQLDELMGTTNIVTSFRFVSDNWYSDQLGEFIFQKLQNKPREIITFLKTVWETDNSFKESVLEWHITTELLYNNPRQHQQADESTRSHSKLLSDYLAYLLFMTPHFVPKSRNLLVDSKAAQVFIQNIAQRHLEDGENFEDCLRNCCQDIFQNPYLWEASPSIMSHAITKATELNNAHGGDTEELWRIISEKWADILLYAASKYDKLEHVRGLCQGGELISVVWLLAFHLGFFPQEANTSFA